MILDKFFVHLRTGEPGKYLASKVLDFYGRLFIGGPSVDEIPGPDKSVRQFLADTYFYIEVDRTPRKRNEAHEISALWVENLRQQEHPQIARAVFIASLLLCTALYSLTGVVGKSATEFREWRAERAQEKAAEEAKEYAVRRASVMKSLAEEVANFSAQQCLDEASKLRVRDTAEQRDRYKVIEQGCEDKRAELLALGQSWSIQQCADFGRSLEAQKKANPAVQFTWADNQIYHVGCMGAHDLGELRRLINAGN
ncbi:hypothetical protein [Pseudomonas sp. Hp2]|uniref:hypothetical protein n=1 Tax=Pseudomonas sp. Hp2 TaxID=701189 RepID=UPI00112B89C9|nr:hypothetical protein [Pseudomonas sp. Hp2]